MNDGLGNEEYSISLPTNDLECFFVEISPTNIQHFVASDVYHPPTPIRDPVVCAIKLSQFTVYAGWCY